MDVKKIRPDSSGWDASVEQEIFGNQTPYASESNSRFPNNNPNDSQVHPPQNLDPNLAIDGGSTPYLARPYIPELGTPNSRAAPDKINERKFSPFFRLFYFRDLGGPRLRNKGQGL